MDDLENLEDLEDLENLEDLRTLQVIRSFQKYCIQWPMCDAFGDQILNLSNIFCLHFLVLTFLTAATHTHTHLSHLSHLRLPTQA